MTPDNSHQIQVYPNSFPSATEERQPPSLVLNPVRTLMRQSLGIAMPPFWTLKTQLCLTQTPTPINCGVGMGGVTTAWELEGGPP